jgi:hypothetical protein
MRTQTLLLCLSTISTCLAGAAERRVAEPPPFSQWLGPQKDAEAKRVIVQETHHALSDFQIALEVVEGVRLRLPESTNPVVIFDGKAFQRVVEYTIHKDDKYVLGTIKLNAELGVRIYRLNVQLKRGPLKGAIVHLWDDRVPEAIRAPYICAYPIPDGYDVSAGPLEFEIVSVLYK